MGKCAHCVSLLGAQLIGKGETYCRIAKEVSLAATGKVMSTSLAAEAAAISSR